jgi:DTW domain-containing protein YfiP
LARSERTGGNIVNKSGNESQQPDPIKFNIADRVVDNWENSAAAKALRDLQANPRVKYIVIIAPDSACPACSQLVGTYPKDQVPLLPVDECSHPLGCRAFYMPYLDEIYP